MGNLSKIGNGKAIVSLNESEKIFLKMECENLIKFGLESDLIKSALNKLKENADIFTDREICAFYVRALIGSSGKNLGLIIILGKLASGLLEVKFDLENLDEELLEIQNF